MSQNGEDEEEMGEEEEREEVRCYNYDQEGHIARECPLPRRPW